MNILVESAIDLSEHQVKTLTDKLQKEFGKKTTVTFKTDSDLIGGIRIVTPTKTVDMSLAARLSQMSKVIHKAD